MLGPSSWTALLLLVVYSGRLSLCRPHPLLQLLLPFLSWYGFRTPGLPHTAQSSEFPSGYGKAHTGTHPTLTGQPTSPFLGPDPRAKVLSPPKNSSALFSCLPCCALSCSPHSHTPPNTHHCLTPSPPTPSPPTGAAVWSRPWVCCD